MIGHISRKRTAGWEDQAETQHRHRHGQQFRRPGRRAEPWSPPPRGSISWAP